MDDDWELHEGGGPLIATAIHAGHSLSPEFAGVIALSDDDRLREEDPFTDSWTVLAPTRIVVHRSRFEVDLNRPRHESVYEEQAWGLDLWRSDLDETLVAASHRRHAAFYEMLQRVLTAAEREHGRFVVYDLHSYNHRRGGPDAPPEEQAGNPQINLGTGSMNRDLWAPVVERFMADLRQHELDGKPLDVRENVRFKGGYLSRWIHENFPTSGCALAIEVKKTFMDEHTGELDTARHEQIGRALAATVPGVTGELTGRNVH